MSAPKQNPFAHWGTGTHLTSWQDAKRREEALAEGLRKLAASEGIKFREPLQIDSNGEFSLVVENGAHPRDPVKVFGPRITALLNESGGARCGIMPTEHMSPENSWCRLNHFAAQSILEKVNGI